MRKLRIKNTSLTIEALTMKWQEEQREYKKWRRQAIRLCLIEPRSAESVATDLGKSPDRVRHVISDYNKQ
jgi:hypothetical protein